jgi:hypothetical protein
LDHRVFFPSSVWLAEELVEQAQAQPIGADPIGIGDAGRSFIQVASESREKDDSDLDRQVMSEIVNYRWVFADRSIFSDIPTALC